MRRTRLREKSQVTLPSRMVKALGLKPGEPIAIELEGDRIVISRPVSANVKPVNPMKFWGSGQATPRRTVEEIDAELRALRSEWDR